VKNYTKIIVTFKDWTKLGIDEDEVTVFKMSGEYSHISYQNDIGQWHRLDGPAVEEADGSKWWYVDGKSYSQEEFERKFK
jgi:hypothetical protein